MLNSSLWQHGTSHVKTEALAALKAMGVSSFISMRLWFLLQCLVKNVYLRFLSHPEVFSLFYCLMTQLLSNPARMAFRAQSWGQLRVGGQPRSCSRSPSLWRKVPGGHGQKLPPGVPAAGISKLFQELGAVLGNLGERGSGWRLPPSHHFPYICEVSDKTIKGNAGSLPSRVAHLRTTPMPVWDHGPHLSQSFQVAKVTLGDTNHFYMWFHSFMP